MKGKIGFSKVELLENIEYIWRTHIPTMFVKKLKVHSKKMHKDGVNFSLVVDHWKEEDKTANVVVQQWVDKSGQYFILKNMYHLREEEAYKRLVPHLKRYFDNNDTNQGDVILDTETMVLYYNKVIDRFPELFVWKEHQYQICLKQEDL